MLLLLLLLFIMWSNNVGLCTKRDIHNVKHVYISTCSFVFVLTVLFNVFIINEINSFTNCNKCCSVTFVYSLLCTTTLLLLLLFNVSVKNVNSSFTALFKHITTIRDDST